MSLLPSHKVLLVLLGPTGVGKTNLSIRLAKHFSCPIVSADSRQLYRELKIGTASPFPEQLNAVQHYFIGSHSIFDTYNAGQYEQDVIHLLDNLFQEHNVILLVGGSMLYIDAVCNGMDDIPTIDTATRNFWQQQYADYGLQYLQQELKKQDPAYFQQVDIHNPKRIMHALEICSISKKTYSDLRTAKRKQRNFDIVKIGLTRPRLELYERINQRTNQMILAGLLQEATQLYPYRHLNTLNTVGYKELFTYIEEKCSFDEAIIKIQQHTRQYAKRQLTWFNKDKEISWFNMEDDEKLLYNILQQVHLL